MKRVTLEQVEIPERPLAKTDWGRVRDILLSTVLAVILAGALAIAASHVARIIVIVIAAALVAYLATPAVSRVERVMPRLLATLLVYTAVLALLVGAIFWISRLFIPQVTLLVQNLPDEIARLQQYVVGLEQSLGQPGLISSQLDNLQKSFTAGGSGTGLAAGASGVATGLRVVTTITDTLTDLVIVLVVGLYFTLDGARFWSGLRSLVPAQHSPKFDFVEMQLNRVIGGYIRGQLTLALIIGGSVGIGMLLLGVHFAVVLGVAGFFFELIPMIGPVLIGALCVIVAAFQGFPLVLWVLIFYVALQLVESNLLGPRISGHAVGLHPAASIIALITGAELFGLVGAVLAVPVTGLAFVVIAATIRYLRGQPVEGLVEPRKPWTLRRSAR